MFQRTPLPAGGPVVYHPGQPEPPRQVESAMRTLSLDEIAAQQTGDESPSLLNRVNKRRSTIVTLMVTVAALSSFGGTVYWAHKQDIERGGPGLPIPMIKAAEGPAKVKPDDPKGQQVPDQDIDAYRRVDPNAVPQSTERLMPPPVTPQTPPAAPPQPSTSAATPSAPSTPSAVASAPTTPTTPAPTAPAVPPVAAAHPPDATSPKISDTGGGPSIASIVDGLNGPAAGGGYRIQVASERSEDTARSTWARLQKANNDVLGSLRMQPARADLGERGTWYRVQAGPLEEKQAKETCARLKTRNVGCVMLPPR